MVIKGQVLQDGSQSLMCTRLTTEHRTAGGRAGLDSRTERTHYDSWRLDPSSEMGRPSRERAGQDAAALRHKESCG